MSAQQDCEPIEADEVATRPPKGRERMVDSEMVPSSPWEMLVDRKTLIALGVSLDTELLAFAVLGAWMYLTGKKIVKGVCAISPLTTAAAVTSAAAANITTTALLTRYGQQVSDGWMKLATPVGLGGYISRWEYSKEGNFKLAQRDWVFKGPAAASGSVAYKVAPLTWGVRLTIHSAVLGEMSQGEDRGHVSGVRGFMTRFTAGAVGEVVARGAAAPVASMLSGGTRSSPSLVVEAPYMGLLLGLYGTLRGWMGGSGQNPVADSFCGATSALFTGLLLHPMRLRLERLRHEHTHNTSYHPRPSSFLPLRDILSARVPHAAVMFPVFTAVSYWATPSVSHGGLVGWDQPPELDKFGEPVDKTGETVGSLLTKRPEVVQSYAYREKRAKAAMEGVGKNE